MPSIPECLPYQNVFFLKFLCLLLCAVYLGVKLEIKGWGKVSINRHTVCRVRDT